jgi:DNA repair photolyase
MKEKMFGEKSHIYYTNDRLFINCVLGCASNCNYCYLDEIGLAKGKIITEINANDIISMLEENISSLWHPISTIVSFGCYSDPWAKISRESTVDIIKYLDKNNYKITLSTKQYIDTSDLNKLLGIKNKNNLVFLISMPITTDISSHEKGTSSLRLRIKSIENLVAAGFKSAIYIKPFIPGVTSQGLPIIKSIMIDYDVPVVLGRLFSTDGTGELAVVSESVKFYENECAEYLNMKESLREVGSVYEHSYEVFSSYQGKNCNEI